MADKFTKYVCEAGDCWDSVCTKTYGAGMEFSFQELLDYNREYSDVIIFEGGEILSVPTRVESPLTVVTVPFSSASTIIYCPSPWDT